MSHSKRKPCKTCAETEVVSLMKDRANVAKSHLTKGHKEPKDSTHSYISALNTGQKWDTTSLTYYFVTTDDTPTVDDGQSETIRNWTNTQKNAMRAAMQAWEDVSALTFSEDGATYETADIKFYLIDDGSYPYLGHAYFPGSVYKGQNYVAYSSANDTDFPVGSYDWITMIHELGHTLGLAHPHDDGGSSTLFPGVSSWSDLGRNQQNQNVYTVMSYNDVNGPVTPIMVQSYGFSGGPMAYDVATIQAIYGAPSCLESGDTTYALATTNTEGTFYEAIVDTGGTDTIDGSSATAGVTIDLRAATVDGSSTGGGKISKMTGIEGGFTIAKGTTIERAIGSDHADTLVDNSGTTTIYGGGGNDRIVLGRGNDTVYGQDGVDTVVLPGRRKNYKIIRFPDRWVFKGRNRKWRRRAGINTLYTFERIKWKRQRKAVPKRKIKPNRRVK